MRQRARRFFLAFEAPGYPFVAASGLAFNAGWTFDILTQGWLVLQLTDSPFWVGAAAGTRGLSGLAFSLAGGTAADRFDRRRTLWAALAIHALVCLVLAALTFAGPVPLWLVLLLVACSGVSGMVTPSLSSIVYDVVGPSRLLNAGAFSFLVGALVRSGAGLAGGFVLDRLGIAPGYAIAAALLITSALLQVPLDASHRRSRAPVAKESPLAALLAGMRYARRHVRLRDLLMLSIVTEAFGFAYLFVLPVLARDVLDAGATGLGALTAAVAAGQFIAMLGLAASGDVRRKGAVLVASTTAVGIAVVALAASHAFVLSIVFALFVGAGASLHDTSMSTLVQLSASSEMRGRVLGLYIATYGMSQVGGFIVGALASIFTVPVALGFAGTVVSLNAIRYISRIGRVAPAVDGALEAPPARA